MPDELAITHRPYIERAVELALQAERDGNLPIGCVIRHGETIVAEGQNHIWSPVFAPQRHAEMEALGRLSAEDLRAGDDLTLYTTLEPCLMCAGAIALHGIGRVFFGALDPFGGAVADAEHLPPYFAGHRTKSQWIGPAYAEACEPLYVRTMALIRKKGAGAGGA